MAKKSKQAPEGNFHIPLAETLKWIEEGEKLQKGWAMRSGKVAEKMTDSFDKHLRKLRKQATKLEKLTAEEQDAKKKARGA